MKDCHFTYEQVIVEVNRKWSLDGEGKEKTRKKNVVALSTVTKAIRAGEVGTSPHKKGHKAKIDRDFLRLVALHMNMEQVGTRGELDAQEIVAVMLAACLGTVHEDKFNTKYAWETCRRENADILIPTGVKEIEDIRWQWVTYEKLDQWFTDKRVSVNCLYILRTS